MNQGEDNNPFRNPNSSINRNRFFGGRTRYNPSQYGGTSENLPQIPNNQAKKKSKKPLIVGIIAVIIVVIAIVAIAIFITKQITTPNSNISDLKQLIETYRENVKYYEDIIKTAQIKGSRLKPTDNTTICKESIKELRTQLSKIEKFREALNHYANLGVGKDTLNYDVVVDDELAELKTLLDKRIPIYKKYKEVNTLILNAYINSGNSESIQALIDYDSKLSEVAEVLKAYYAEYNNYSEQQTQNSCNKNKTAICKSISKAKNELLEAIWKDKAYDEYNRTYIGEYNLDERPVIIIDIIDQAKYEKEHGDK